MSTESVKLYENYIQSEQKGWRFYRDALRSRSWSYMTWLLFAIFLSVIVFKLYGGNPRGSIRPSVFIYYLVISVHLVYRIKTDIKLNFMAPDILFVFVYTLFHLGYVTFHALGIFPYLEDIYFFESSIPKALFIVNLGLISFLAGYEFLGSNRNSVQYAGEISRPTELWCIWGLILIVLAILMHMGVIGYMGIGFFKYHGYKAFQDIEKITGSRVLGLMMRFSVKIMILGIIVYCISSSLRYGKLFHSKVALTLVITFFIMIILEGDRGPLVQMGIPMLLIRHYFIKPVKLWIVIVLVISSFTLFSMLSAVRRIVYDPQKMYSEYQYLKESGIITWKSPFLEMGGSFLVVNITAYAVPGSESYWYGESWKDAVIHVVPFLSGIFVSRGWAKWPPSSWITYTYFGPDAAGRAFTASAEGYLNFGYPGVMLELFIVGLYIRWLTKKMSRNPSAMWGLIFFGSLGIVIMIVRNHSGIVVSPIIRLMILSWFLNSFFGYENPEYELVS
jgi:oligosaccharide repeat unit polymerase